MRRLSKWIGLGAALAFAATAATAATPAEDAYAQWQVAQKRWEDGQAAYEAWSAKRPGWTTTESGLQWRRIKKASSKAKQPTAEDVVTIHYVGTFIDGREFDSSRKRGEPATFPLYQLIQGWQEGVPLMRVGERFEFVIPAKIAYGPRYRAGIPGNSTLLFDIELLGVGEE
jgi:FKBP-type peptidyl-prolyl cis-trans isomerase FkpA